MGEYVTYLLPGLFMLVGGSLIYLLNKGSRRKRLHDITAEEPIEVEIADKVFMSKYLGGFPNAVHPASLVFCTITEDNLIFNRGAKGMEIGRMRRDALQRIIVDEGSKIAQELTVADKLELGQLVNGIKSKDKSYCLVIDWDNGGVRRKAVFEFRDKQCKTSAQESAAALRAWIKPPTPYWQIYPNNKHSASMYLN